MILNALFFIAVSIVLSMLMGWETLQLSALVRGYDDGNLPDYIDRLMTPYRWYYRIAKLKASFPFSFERLVSRSVIYAVGGMLLQFAFIQNLFKPENSDQYGYTVLILIVSCPIFIFFLLGGVFVRPANSDNQERI